MLFLAINRKDSVHLIEAKRTRLILVQTAKFPVKKTQKQDIFYIFQDFFNINYLFYQKNPIFFTEKWGDSKNT